MFGPVAAVGPQGAALLQGPPAQYAWWRQCVLRGWAICGTIAPCAVTARNHADSVYFAVHCLFGAVQLQLLKKMHVLICLAVAVKVMSVAVWFVWVAVAFAWFSRS
jgi:hypothetical protein